MIATKLKLRRVPFLALIAQLCLGGFAVAAEPQPWLDPTLSPDRRVDLLLPQMTLAEKQSLIFSFFGSNYKPSGYRPPAEALMGSAGYTPGIPRLGIPAQFETDAGLGVATQRESSDPYRERTSLPSGLATAATWNPDLAFKGGAMIGREARDSGFNIMLAGGINLVREPRNGRNFEYAGEDPLLAGRIVGAEIRGIQSNNIVATIKHFALNAQETGRMVVSSNIADDQARMSDLLAFQLAIEDSDPGAVMCAYNRYNGVYSCENDFLLNHLLKGSWGYPGWVMSDWGGQHSTAAAAKAGLDQESGYVFDKQPFFAPETVEASLQNGSIAPARLDDMVRRILRSLFAKGVIDHPAVLAPIDFAAHAAVTQADEEEGIVLLKNTHGLLPLVRSAKKIAVIGAHADKGVLAGGGSSTVFPVGGNPVPGLGLPIFPGPIVYHPSVPLAAIRARLPDADLRFDEGDDPARAAQLASECDLVILFADQWTGEDLDASLTLPDRQDQLITAVAKANPRTIVVLETGGPVLMPWLGRVPALLEAWYPGTRGGEAIARVLFGEIDASGRLPVSFPRSLQQLPRPTLDGLDKKREESFDVDYREGAAVGYKWYDHRHIKPLFAFGHGLSYTSFAYRGLQASQGPEGLTIRFAVENNGARPGKAVPQIYIGPTAGGWEAPRRLVGWQKLTLDPKEAETVALTVDPRLLAQFDGRSNSWKIAAGTYRVQLGASAGELPLSVDVMLPAQTVPDKK